MQAFLDSSGEGGVVYVSLGTVCSIGADEFRELASALSGLPAHVVWKASEADMPAGMHLGSLDLGSNVKVIVVAVFHSRIISHVGTAGSGTSCTGTGDNTDLETDALDRMPFCIRREHFQMQGVTWPLTPSCLICRWCSGRHRMICWGAAV